jgi:hypothetical protein
MWKKLKFLLYSSVEARFPTRMSVEEAVDRLSRNVIRGVWRTLFFEAVVGSVTADRVVLHRHRPWLHNSFIPFFRGRFVREGDRTVLSGAFGMARLVQVFVTLWLGMVVLFFALFLLAPSAHSEEPFPFFGALIALGMFCFGVGLVWFGRRIGRSDIEYISAVVRDALEV